MIDSYKADQPELEYINNEEEYLFYCYCTLITLHKGTKLNIVNIFLNTLCNKYERKLFKQLLSLDTDYDVVQCFLKYAPHLASSKYVTKKINKGNFYNK